MSMHTAAEPALRRLTREQLADYQRDGFLILRNVFSTAEIAELDREAQWLVGRHDLINVRNIRCRWKDHLQTKVCTFECFDPVIDLSPDCERFAHDRRILDAIGDLYGEPAHLFKDKLIFKPAGVEGYKLHQDWISWNGFPTSFVTVLVPIDDCDRTNGSTVVDPGCHHSGYVSPFDGEYHNTPKSWVAGVTPVQCAKRPARFRRAVDDGQVLLLDRS